MTTVISFVIDQREVLLHFWRKRQRLWPEPRFQVRAEPDTGAATAAGTAILALSEPTGSASEAKMEATRA